TIAVVGLSPKALRPSHVVARYLRDAGYRIVPVNPGHATLLGERCYPTLTAAAGDHAIDVVDVFRRREFAAAVVGEAIPLRPRILVRVVAAVLAVTETPPLVVANAPEGPSWRPDLRTIPDVRPGCGSLGGIYTAVVAGDGPVLCVAWDMPFLTEDVLRALVSGAAGYDAYLPESGPQGLPTGRPRRGG